MMQLRKQLSGWGLLAPALLVLVSAWTARETPVSAQIPTPQVWRIYPYVLTGTPTTLCGGAANSTIPCGKDAYVCQADVNSGAGTAATITITDNQASPAAFWPGVAPLSAAAASSYKIFDNSASGGSCRFFPKGVIVSSSGGTITLSMGGYYY
jgi:hypothetical protein